MIHNNSVQCNTVFFLTNLQWLEFLSTSSPPPTSSPIVTEEVLFLSSLKSATLRYSESGESSNPVHILTRHLFKIIFNVCLPSMV